MAIFTGTSGVDNFVGTDTAADTFRFFPAHLAGTDTVSGGLGTVGDTLQLLGAGAVSAGQLANVSGIEAVRMFANSSIDLTANMLATARNNTIIVFGSAGNDGVFGGDITNAAHRVVFAPGAGRDSFIGGLGIDKISISASDITNQDIFTGGEGPDTIEFTTAGALASTALANVFSFEFIKMHSGGNDVRLLQATVGSTTNGLSTVIGSNANDQVNASSVVFGRVFFNAGEGNDTLFGGASGDVALGGGGNDDLSGNGGNDTLNGGGGNNLLSGDAGDDVLINGSGTSTVVGGAGRDTVALFGIDPGNPDTLNYNSADEGTALGDLVRGDIGFVTDGDVAFAFNLAAFDTLGNNFDAVNLDDGTNGAGSNGADLVLFNDGAGAGLGSAAAVDAYFVTNYFAATGVGAFLAEYDNASNSVTIYYDPDAFGFSAVHVIAKIENMNDRDHAALGDDFSFV